MSNKHNPRAVTNNILHNDALNHFIVREERKKNIMCLCLYLASGLIAVSLGIIVTLLGVRQ